MEQSPPTFRRQWVVPIVVLTITALAAFWAFYILDSAFTGGGPGHTYSGPIDRYVHFDPNSITDAVSALAGTVAAVLGIVITVVSIVVQLSADRYTGVARMFLRDHINLGVMGYYVITCVSGVWLSVSLKTNYVPRATLLAMLIATTLALVLMAPYFFYVFWFLEPSNIITRIRQYAEKESLRGSRAQNSAEAGVAQAQTLGAMEELTDITSNSIAGKDKIIASRAIDAMKDFVVAYIEHKRDASSYWFTIGLGIQRNPDFVAMDPESLQDLEGLHTWAEWIVMRQYLGIYNESLRTMSDINYLIAIDTRYIGEAAARAEDKELLTLTLRFMNSYLRSTLNARDVRTAYNVLNQYRLLVESLLQEGASSSALEATKYIIYYGQLSFDMTLHFVTETAAYDVSTLVQVAHTLGADVEDQMLTEFLELDQPLRLRSQEQALMGVRKAQVKLAAYYLMKGEEAKARQIARDMAEEPPERLKAIREQLTRVTTKDFWEIIDRGRNFEYMIPAQRACMEQFFGWLHIQEDEPPPEEPPPEEPPSEEPPPEEPPSEEPPPKEPPSKEPPPEA